MTEASQPVEFNPFNADHLRARGWHVSTSTPDKQLRLPFLAPKESRAEKVERLLSGKMGHFVKPASVLFNYQVASKIARRAKHAPRRIIKWIK